MLPSPSKTSLLAEIMHSYTFIGFAALVAAVSCSAWEVQAHKLPELKLPYGTWRANKYDKTADVYVFKNIRFAAPPVGPLRFAKPAPPRQEKTVQTGDFGPGCITKMAEAVGPGFLSNLVDSIMPTSEDCLFLDVYVPRRALEQGRNAKFPVIYYFYGGGFDLGAKDQIYDGNPLVKQSNGTVIYVSANYRLGPLGFLAGKTAEKEGITNVALYDQRAALKWVQDYISLVGGDPANVSAWGESAGAGSVMLHLTAFGGKQDPLFRRAIIQSPFLEPRIDRAGYLEDHYQRFVEGAGCKGKGLSCLRAAKFQTLQKGANLVFEKAPSGTFAFGPAPDGKWMRQLPLLEFASGNYWKKMDSIIVTHVADEGEMFTPKDVTNQTQWKAYLDKTYPRQPSFVKQIMNHYSPVNTTRQMAKLFVDDSTFRCNTRFITQAYPGITYSGRYARLGGLHGTDIIATFYSPGSILAAASLIEKNFENFAAVYQSYLLSHSRSGDPNKFSVKTGSLKAINWPKVQDTPKGFTNVLNAGVDGFSLIVDMDTAKDICDFWLAFQTGLTKSLGIAPPL